MHTIYKRASTRKLVESAQFSTRQKVRRFDTNELVTILEIIPVAQRFATDPSYICYRIEYPDGNQTIVAANILHIPD